MFLATFDFTSPGVTLLPVLFEGTINTDSMNIGILLH